MQNEKEKNNKNQTNLYQNVSGIYTRLRTR
jgi:hypothetical protein